MQIDSAIAECINNVEFIQGRHVKIFEEAFSKYLNVQHVIGCANGTDAIYLALKALNVGYGDEVITAANSFIATSEAITMTGARVVFADVDPETNNISPEDVLSKISDKTKVLLPVCLYGLPVDIKSLNKIAEKYNLRVVADCAQAHGAEINGKSIAGMVDIATYSFFPGKNLGAFGDAGAVATNNSIIAEYVAKLRNHGRGGKYIHDFEGYNMRMDEIQGAILAVKLPFLRGWNQSRRELADIYSQRLNGIGDLKIYKEPEGLKSAYHLYVVETRYREELRKYLLEKGISTGIHYPIPLPVQPAYEYLKLKEADFPVSCNKAKKILSLPIFPEMDKEQHDYIIAYVIEFFKNKERNV
ncbi:MAG: DegT/DnrJ/EryC1/StrS family aminotransferase [Candidatus Omnitrophota bacterium]